MRKVYLKFFSIIYLSKIWRLKTLFDSNKDVIIIMYHDLIDKELFKKQMIYVKNNFNVIRLEEYIKFKKSNSNVANRSLIITFDDGYESTYSIAMPVLNELELEATVFVSPALLSDYNKDLNFNFMSIEQLLEMSKCEFIDIGGHTFNHVNLDKLQYNEAYKEIFEGKRFLEELLLKEINTFAYPFGKKCNYNLNTISIVREIGFLGAVTTNRFKNGKASIYELNRVGINYRDTFEIFVAKINRFYPYKIIDSITKLKKYK